MMHAAGIKVFPYNMETSEEIERMLVMNVDGVIINDPLEALKWLKFENAA